MSVPHAAPGADRPVAVAAGVALSVVSVATFLLLPQVVAGAVQTLGLTEREVGMLSAAIMAGSAVSAIAAGAWVRRARWHRAARLALLGLVACNAVSLFAHGWVPFLLLQGAAGVCGGSLYSLALTALSDGRHADRHFGYAVAAQVAFQVAGLLGGPLLLARGGLDALLLAFVALGSAALLLVPGLPAAGRVLPTVAAGDGLLRAPTLFALGGCFLFFFNVGCYWTYIELIGGAAGIAAQPLANGLAAGVAFGIAGALAGSWCGERYGRLRPIAIGAALTLAAAGVLGGAPGLAAFTTAAILYNFAWNYSLTYQYAIVNAVDPSGRGVAVAPAFHAAGGAAGPAVAAVLVPSAGLGVIRWLVAAAVLASFGAFALAALLERRRPHPETDR